MASWDAFRQAATGSARRSSFRPGRDELLGRTARWADDVVLVFGRETAGLRGLHERYGERVVSMPILSPRVRSLNLSTTVGIALYEVP